MIYVFNVYQLECKHVISTEGILKANAYTYCPECQVMSRVVSCEVHAQEIDDVEEMPG